MSEAVGVVVAIGVAIVAIIAIFAYIQVSRFCENSRVQLTRFVDACENLEKNYGVTLKKLGDAADQFSVVAADFRDKIEIIERDLSPLAKNLDRTLTDANPLVKSLADGSEDIRGAVESIRRTAADAADVADGVHEVIMPIINGLRGLVLALSEGVRVLRQPKK